MLGSGSCMYLCLNDIVSHTGWVLIAPGFEHGHLGLRRVTSNVLCGGLFVGHHWVSNAESKEAAFEGLKPPDEEWLIKSAVG